MNIQTLTFLALFAIGSIGCSPGQKEEMAKVPSDALLGTWKLVSYVDHQEGGTSWGKYGNNVIYEKYITPTHFTWVRYEKDNDNLVGIGGGTYTFDGKTYTEDIKFFLPPGSSQLGQAIPFEVAFEDGLWEHVGFSKVLEFDADKGEMTVVDSLKIEEKWEKVEAGVNTSHLSDILGTWELLSYRQEGDSLRSEYPGFVSYIKLITPTHFVWVRYNKEGDEVVGAPSRNRDDRDRRQRVPHGRRLLLRGSSQALQT